MNHSLLFMLLMLLVFCQAASAQNNAIFNGGDADGYAQSSVTVPVILAKPGTVFMVQ